MTDQWAGVDTEQRSEPIAPVCALRIEREIHERGYAWRWGSALANVRAECSACRPAVSCWRHDAPVIELVGYVSSFGYPAVGISECVGCGEGDGGTTLFGTNGTMVASACEPCVERYVGAVA